ncbi:MAG: hypothetical protein HRT61_15070 [Ekhidna sp.]|nr:hypothetical protein [Ekhidna sp.]
MKKGYYVVFFLLIWSKGFSQNSSQPETNLAGVFQGKTLFIQNPFDRVERTFCIQDVFINEERVDLNYKVSALKIDFDGLDLYTPVKIRLVHKDTLCSPTIINPEAILFHTIFRFSSVFLSDSALTWSTKGEVGKGEFEVERLQDGLWVDQEIQDAVGKYEEVEYQHFPNMEEGANRYRIRYNFPSGSRSKYLYSQEVSFDFYPEPVTYSPRSATTRLYLSRSTHYEIYDEARRLVHEGQGKEIDVTVLRRGKYVIYFNGKDPGTFLKE